MSESKFRPEFKTLMRLAIPVAGAQLATLSMHLVDTVFVGQLGAAALGGVGLANAWFTILLLFGLGVLFGMDYPTSHAFGAGRNREANEYLIQALYLVTAISIPLTLMMYFGAGIFPYLGADPLAASEAERYLRVVCWSLWPNLAFLALRQYLQAMGTANAVLVILVIANFANALGNWVFISGRWGAPALAIVGSALSTLIARVLMFLMVSAHLAWVNRKKGLELGKTALRVLPERMKTIARYGIPASGQVLLEVGVFSGSTFLAGTLGAVPLAAHQIVLQVASFTFMIPLGIGSAAAVRVAQALGREDPASAARVGSIAIACGAALMTCVGVSLFLSAETILRIFTQDPRIVATGSSLLLIAAVFQLSDSLQVITTGALRGVGDTRTSMIVNFVGHWLIGLPIGATLCFALGKGIIGLWIGLSIGLSSVAVALVWAWRGRTANLRLLSSLGSQTSSLIRDNSAC